MNAIASDLSYEVSQRRRRLGEIGLPVLHLDAQAFQLRCQQPVVRESVPADRIVGISEAEWDDRQRQARLR